MSGTLVKIKIGRKHNHNGQRLTEGDTFMATYAEMRSFGDKFEIVPIGADSEPKHENVYQVPTTNVISSPDNVDPVPPPGDLPSTQPKPLPVIPIEDTQPCFSEDDFEGIGSAVIEKLHKAGYCTLKDLMQAPNKDLFNIEGIGRKIISKIREVAPYVN